MPGNSHCPLCGAPDAPPFHRDKRREYLRCAECALVFVPPAYLLTRDEEKAEYDLHRNDPDDAGYRRFLSRLAEPLLQRLAPGSSGLDFGCGPGPALAAMLREAGHEVVLYDSFYAADAAVLERRYEEGDVIVLFSLAADVPEVERLLQVSIDFF